MANYEQLKAAIKDVIKTNGNQEITGQVLQNSLLNIISTLGDNATFAGVATPITNPGTPDANVFWLAGKTGTYSNFDGLKVEDETAVFYNNNGWHKFDTGIPSKGKIENMESKISEANNRVGNTDYVVCSVGSIIADKAITIPNYELNTKTRILVKMNSVNTANNATLKIYRESDTIPAKPLFYNGVRVSADNSWEAGAVLDIYFDGTNFQATQLAGCGAGGNKILGGTSGDAVFNYLKNQVMFFFGDSITQGTDGGYVGLVKDKVGLGNAVNYGSSGASTSRLVDIMTGLGIREPKNVRNIDYMTCNAITIQIGTNRGVSGNFVKDIPNISIYDIKSYPYTYNNPDGTITNTTLDNAEDYFKKLFPDTFYGNLALCLEWVRWKNPNCRVYLITIPPSNRNNHIAVRDALIELGNLYSIHVIDAQANSGCSIRSITEWSLDKVHFNIIGNELWASYIARELVTNYYDTEIES